MKEWWMGGWMKTNKKHFITHMHKRVLLSFLNVTGRVRASIFVLYKRFVKHWATTA